MTKVNTPDNLIKWEIQFSKYIIPWIGERVPICNMNYHCP